jgi:ubiquinone/menaquinone biosynthesis C-methylase UbiE/DNA-binding transcriptional ArsR family regulator
MLKWLKLLADPTRVRIVRILNREKLSVAELQEILEMGQSRISSQLAQLKGGGLVEDERSGKHIFYQLSKPSGDDAGGLEKILAVVESAASEIPECEQDSEALKLVLAKRSDRARLYFDELAGKFGRNYVPGRSWKGLAETLLKLMTPGVVADLGAGEGTLAQLLAQRAEKVIAIDSSEKMVEFGAAIALKNGYSNLEYRLGDIQSPPIDDDSVDLCLFSQALHHASKPKKALTEAFRITRPGGRVVVMDLLKHDFEEARELYADLWLGFAEVEIRRFLDSAGFQDIESAIVDKEQEHPYFQTLMAIARKPV